MRLRPTDLRAFLCLGVLAALLTNALPGQGGFTPGHIYLHTQSLPAAGGGGGLVHIDPYSGSAQVLLNYTAYAYGNGIYDAYRDRILVQASIGGVHKLYAVDASGTAVDAGAPLQLYSAMASRGDGIVYCKIFSGTVLSYLDAANALHTLADATGVTPYAFPGGVDGIRRMIYHPGENALYAATPSGYSPCAGGAVHLNMYKLPLSADGTRVVGPVICGQATVAAGGGEEPVDWSLTPSGALLLVVDTNSGPAEPRMLLVDPGSLSAAPFAWNGPYIGEAANSAGVFSTALGAAVILDSFNDVLRVYPPGSSGTGTILSTGVSSFGSGENATLFEIQPAGISHTLKANTGTLSLLAGGTQVLDFTPGPTHAGDVYLVGGSITGWAPGIPYGGYVIPLVYDWYTDHTIVNANLGPLFSNLGVLSGMGVGQAQLVVPPNSPPGLAGVTVFHAAVAFGSGFVLQHASNPVALVLGP